MWGGEVVKSGTFYTVLLWPGVWGGEVVKSGTFYSILLWPGVWGGEVVKPDTFYTILLWPGVRGVLQLPVLVEVASDGHDLSPLFLEWVL